MDSYQLTSSEKLQEIKSLTNNEDKINTIVDYLIGVNKMLKMQAELLEKLTLNQTAIQNIFDINNDSFNKIAVRLEEISMISQSHGEHLSAHDKHLEILSDNLSKHSEYITELFSLKS